MKIGLLLPNIWMAKRFGARIFAPGQLFTELADELVTRGNTVFVYSSSNTNMKAHLVMGDEELADKDLSASTSALSELLTFREYDIDLTSRAIAHANTEKLDILHDYGGYSAPYFLKFAQMPLVFSIHNAPPPPSTLDYYRAHKFKDYHFVALSQSHKRGYNRLGMNNIDVVYNGIQLNDFRFNDDPDLSLVNLGRFIPEKGISIAIQLAMKLRIPIKLASSTEFQDTDYYHQEIKPYLGSEFVQRLPFVQGDEKSRTLKNAKLFLSPIQWEEPFGLVFIESMATGTPVVAFARGSVPEIIEDGETGLLVNPSDDDIRGDWIIKKTGIEGLCEAVERIYALPQKQYQEMRRACRAHVEKNFTVKTMAEEYENLYKKILDFKI